jgi:glycosyltransferase involved in cell wall biosynthesis
MISVVIPTHNPRFERLRMTLAGLRAQSLDRTAWELLVVDNASGIPPTLETVREGHPNARIVREERLGLTAARVRGFREALGDIVVLVDDDNVLNRDYLHTVEDTFATDGSLGAIGGRSFGRFGPGTPEWLPEFHGLLAVRDLGGDTLRAKWDDGCAREYPICSPIGAGMALRKSCADTYVRELASNPDRFGFDRTGESLTSGGDNDIVMSILGHGWDVAYVPALSLDHLIPNERCDARYLARLNRAIARSWIRVLALHGVRPWKSVSPKSVRLRQTRAWWRHRAWRGPAQQIRWQGACGHFEGLADLWRADCAGKTQS